MSGSSDEPLADRRTRIMGEVFREIGILVLVFGLLDHLISDGKLRTLADVNLPLVLGVFSVGLLSIFAGMALDLSLHNDEEVAPDE